MIPLPMSKPLLSLSFNIGLPCIRRTSHRRSPRTQPTSPARLHWLAADGYDYHSYDPFLLMSASRTGCCATSSLPPVLGQRLSSARHRLAPDFLISEHCLMAGENVSGQPFVERLLHAALCTEDFWPLKRWALSVISWTRLPSIISRLHPILDSTASPETL